MTGSELSGALHTLGLSAGQLARLGIANDVRIRKWLRGEEEIPAWLPVLLELLKLPGGTARALAVAESHLMDENGK